MIPYRAVRLILLIMVTAIVATGCRGCLKDRFGRFFGGNAPGAMDPYGSIDSSVLPDPIRGQTPQEIPELKRIYFAFDSAELLEPAKAQLRQNAQWMQSNPGVAIQIEGHCDERGTADYNYALGQRRADAARNYLISQGVDPGRLHTISYGSERPDDPGQNEMAWARNRRAQFLVYGAQ
ncbi:MAG: peptidoglycan-associated lipoprotein Pal [Candidatus Sumerlaeaceae bacterium]|nr:peptidoglycan-associated lipoprotein Pal [Candidatus Sumerlaeaceae bacterium]